MNFKFFNTLIFFTTSSCLWLDRRT